jgi:3-deoxy-D-manno-octulosonate 8-phosphate phosphatase (KDO 8-P phosphatase)
MKNKLPEKLNTVKLFLFDLEGVLIQQGSCNENCFETIKHACSEFNNSGLMFGIVTARTDDEFIKKLKTIEGCIVLSGSLDKVSATDNFLAAQAIDYQNVFYMGDDLLDIPLLKKCGVSCAPQSARREVKRVVTFLSQSESCEEFLKELINYCGKSKETQIDATKY